MLTGSDDNDNKLFSSNNNSFSNDDGTINDSFVLSMKANEPGSVSEKLKENAESKSLNSIEDEFDNFEFDSSISAFKPFNNTPDTSASPKVSPFESNTASTKTEEVKSEVIPEVRKPNLDINTANTITSKSNDNSLFEDNDPDMVAFAGLDNNKPFTMGQDLDFAGSSSSNSTFSNPAPVSEKTDFKDDLELDEDIKNINPFKSNEPTSESPFTSKIEKADDTIEANTSIPEKKTEDVIDNPNNEEAIPANLHTYGNVTSGVNAFGKRKSNVEPSNSVDSKDIETSTPSEKKDNVPTNASETKSEISPDENISKPIQPVVESLNEAQDTVATNKPVESQPKPAAPIKRPSAAANQMKSAESTPINSAFAPKGRTNAAPQRPAAKAPAAPSNKPSQTKISPVTQVKAKKSKPTRTQKEPGKLNIIILIAVFVLIIGLCFIAEKLGNNKINNKERTVATTSTKEETSATTIEETTTAAETTTEATTEATTTTTVAETTTEETTIETTTEVTSETTTAATTTTTAATTTRATSVSPTFSYSIANPSTTATGFTFDIAITNTGNADVNMSSALNQLNITIACDTDITAVSSDYFTFTTDSSDDHTFIGSIRSNTIPAGETVYATITVTTSEHVVHFNIPHYRFT